MDTGSLPDDTLQAYTRACPPDSAYTAADVIGLVNSLGNSYRLIFQTEAVQPLPEITNIIASLLSVAQYSSGSIDQTYEQGGNNWLTLIRVSLTAGQESTQTLLSGVVGYQLTVPADLTTGLGDPWLVAVVMINGARKQAFFVDKILPALYLAIFDGTQRVETSPLTTPFTLVTTLAASLDSTQKVALGQFKEVVYDYQGIAQSTNSLVVTNQLPELGEYGWDLSDELGTCISDCSASCASCCGENPNDCLSCD